MSVPAGRLRDVPRLHVVTDDDVIAGHGFVDLASDLLRQGDGKIALHLRGPTTSGARLYRLAMELREFRESLVINDRVDVALAAGLRRVHLGGRSLPPGVARSILGEGALLGVSTHSRSGVRAAATEGADWIFVGTIYATPSHPGRPGRGLAAVEEATAEAKGSPVLAIGGVGPEHVRELRAAGAHGVAVIRGVWGAVDPLLAINEYLEGLGTENQRRVTMNGATTIQVRINGKDRDVDEGHTVRSLIESLELHPSLVVVELNREILSRDAYGEIPVQEGDVIELVHFVGGG